MLILDQMLDVLPGILRTEGLNQAEAGRDHMTLEIGSRHHRSIDRVGTWISNVYFAGMEALEPLENVGPVRGLPIWEAGGCGASVLLLALAIDPAPLDLHKEGQQNVPPWDRMASAIGRRTRTVDS